MVGPETDPGLRPEATESYRVEKLEEFQENITSFNITPLDIEIDINADNPAEDAVNRFLTSRYDTEPTFYINPDLEQYEDESIVGFNPYTSRSGTASYHGVFFGELHFSDGSQIDVAVKPHDLGENNVVSDQRSCLNDYFKNLAAKNLGFESLQSIGLMVDKEGTQYSITSLDETIDTFDTADWTSYFEDGQKNIGMKEQWYKAALYSALLHSNGDSYHGDMAARNFAINTEGHVFLIDWEHGNVTDKEANDIEQKFGHTFTDIQSLMTSMARPADLKFNPGIGLFKHSQDWWADFKETFLEDYMVTRLAMASQGSHHMRALRDTQDELVQLEASLKQKMMQYEEMYSPAIATQG